MRTRLILPLTCGLLGLLLPTAGGAPIVWRRGTISEPVEIAMDVAHLAIGGGSPGRGGQPLRWTNEGGALVGSTEGSGWSATIRLAPQDGATALDVALRVTEPAEVTRERVRLMLPGVARVVHRDLRWAPLHEPLRVGRGTPIVAATATMAVVGGEGFVAARYVPREAAKGNPTATATMIDLVLDDEAAHPFSIYERCWEHLDPTTPWRDYEHRIAHARLVRPAGAVVEGHAVLYPLDPSTPALPAIIERWPAGARAAVVLTDHADRTDPQALRAVLYGTSDPHAPDYGTHGLFAHGLRITKTFFARDRLGGLATDAAARALADEIVARGSEVGAHTITPDVDPRERVRAGLDAFTTWRAVTWIDHEPYTNCEDVSSRGAEAGGPFAILDLLRARGYRWIWAATDVARGTTLADDDLFAGDPLTAPPAFFPLPAEPGFQVFGSSWMYERPDALAAIFTDAALDGLETRRGLVVAHTYLSASEMTTKLPDHRRRLVVHRTASGALALDPAVESVFARLGARVAAGRLVVPPWREVGERLLALADLATTYDDRGAVTIANRSATDLAGLTLAIAAPGLSFAIEGAQVEGSRAESDRSSVWFSLRAGHQVTVQATRDRHPVPLLPHADATPAIP